MGTRVSAARRKYGIKYPNMCKFFGLNIIDAVGALRYERQAALRVLIGLLLFP